MDELFTKERTDAPDGFFEVEAAGLRWLGAAGPDAADVATLHEVGPSHISLERLDPASPSKQAAEAFGRALARTHAAGATAYGQGPDGWSVDGFIGRQPLSLRPGETWGRFYAEQRVLPYARKARDVGHLGSSDAARIDRVCDRLFAGEFDDDRLPARIHGDLWSGNVIFTDRGVVLIDPAAHGGHGLTDLAMLHLFGAPELATITDAYAEAANLDRDFSSLIGLHQLHPLLAHAVSHGPAYGDEAAAVAAAY